MKKDRLIKNHFQSVCDPEKSFEEFCRENNIATGATNKPRRRVGAWLLKGLVPALSAAAVVLAVVLPITLKNVPSVPDEGLTAPVLAVHSNTVTVDEVLADTDVTLLDLQYLIAEYAQFGKMYMGNGATDGDHVGYEVNAKVYGAKVDGVPYVYGFELTTAKRNALAVLDKSAYYGCDKSVTYGDVIYSYRVDVGFAAGMHVYYTIGNYEYFLRVTPFGTAAIAKDENYMLMFLRLAFDGVDGAETIRIDF